MVKRRAGIGLLGLLLLVGLVAGRGATGVQAATLDVCDTCTYTTIQAAINAASNGDTINVAAETFDEQLTIDKNVTISGADGATLQPTADSTAPDPAWDVQFVAGSSGATLEGMTLDFNGPSDNRPGRGIGVSDLNGDPVENVTIQDNDITMGVGTGAATVGEEGVGIQTGRNADVDGLTITGNAFHGGSTAIGDGASEGEEGIYINPNAGNGSITVSNNTFNGELFTGISVEADNVTVTGNTIQRPSTVQNTNGIRFNDFVGGVTWSTTITGNTVTGFANGLRLGPGGTGSTLNVTATGNTISGNTTGIWVRADAVLTATDNSISGNPVGMDNDSATQAAAERNWWGHEDGPDGAGDDVTGDVDFSPWCADADCNSQATSGDISGGGTVSTGSDATADDPVDATVTHPDGTGTITIDETDITETAPDGFTFIGHQVNITAPAASAGTPIEIELRVHTSIAGTDPDAVNVYKDGVEVADCDDNSGTAIPDPCVASRTLSGDEIVIEVLTSEASSWNLGQATQVFTFGNTSYSVGETDDSVSVVVQRSDSAGEVTVDWTVNEIGEAAEGTDFTGTSGTLTFSAGDTQEEIDIDSGAEVTASTEIEVLDDGEVEPHEDFEIVLSNPSAGWGLDTPDTTTVTILGEGDTLLRFADDRYEVAEGSGSVDLTVERLGSLDGTAEVDFFTVESDADAGVDYTVTTSSPLQFADGESVATISIDITDDGDAEFDERFEVVLDNPSAGAGLGDPDTATVIILDDEQANPRIDMIDPAEGPETGGNIVTITGENLDGATSASFGGTATTDILTSSATEVQVMAPAGTAGAEVQVTVTTSVGTSADDDPDAVYTYTDVPEVTDVTPDTGPVEGGTDVTITGEGFDGATAVFFGEEEVDDFTVVSDTEITTTSPAATEAGDVFVRVRNDNGLSAESDDAVFTYADDAGLVEYELFSRWTLLTWAGLDGIDLMAALEGDDDNEDTNDISGAVTAVWYLDSATGDWQAAFPNQDIGIPGASDLDEFLYGEAYWVAINVDTITWTVEEGEAPGGLATAASNR